MSEDVDQREDLNPEITLEGSEDRRRIQHLHLVLTAAAIESSIRHEGGRYLLVIPPLYFEQASLEIQTYLQEQEATLKIAAKTPVTTSHAKLGVLLYLITLLLMMYLQQATHFGEWIRTQGEMQTASLREGQWWRSITALTLHQDAAHLAGNLAMGAMYGWMVSQRLGAGLGWLSIIAAGSLGNCVSGLLHSPGHTSLGASTAVFSALGILAADATLHRFTNHESRFRKWLPIISASVLLAWTGTGGPRTDVIAHLTGFTSGMLIGVLLCADFYLWPNFLRRRQLLCAAITLFSILIGWTLALLSSH